MLAFKGVFVLLIVAELQFLSTYVTANPINVDLEEFKDEDYAGDEGNEWEKSGYFEGDIILDDSLFRNGRLVGGKPARFKSTEVLVAIDPGFDAGQQAAIRKAFDEYHRRTCIRFKEIDGNTKEDHIYIQVSDKGCSSQVGRIGGRQHINLKKSAPGSGCFRHGTIVHELLHALGFFHQQSATNRDRYVKIMWENIKKDAQHNFKKYSRSVSTAFGVEYDYGSVLHYSGKAFSTNGKPTIVPKQTDAKIGQRTKLSDKDIQKLHLMYSCPAPGGYHSAVDAETDLEELLTESELLA